MVQSETIDNAVCRMLAELAAAYGVKHVVVSPGTRSAPLAVTLHRSDHFVMHTVIDERSAAFMALGMAVATATPVVLICTSGSAMMNYGPALAEAYYRRVPMIVITADRPERWIDQLDSQTMRQSGALSAVVRRSVDIPVAAATDRALFDLANRQVNEAFDTAISLPQGPVHINVQLDVPLTAMSTSAPLFDARRIVTLRPTPSASAPEFDNIVEYLQGKKIAVVCAGTTLCERSGLQALANAGIPVLTEIQSNIPSCFNIGSFDRMLDSAPGIIPEVIVSIGGSLVSARLKRWLRSIPNLMHITVGYDDNATDTFGHLAARIECQPGIFVDVLKRCNAPQDFIAAWSDFYTTAQSRTNATIAGNPLLDALANIARTFHGDVHVSNGSAIRYAQMLPWIADNIECNRGISGIDGCTSTAIGAAIASGNPTMLITGDMSAAYDVAALGAAQPPAGFRIAVLDNAGGDIFRNISATARLPELDRYFVAKPRLPLQQLAHAYGYTYAEYDCCAPDASTILKFAGDNTTPAILRIIIDPKYTAHLL